MGGDGWLETYRGTVCRWEVDHNDHLTVAYYLARFADAAHALLDDIEARAGAGAAAPAPWAGAGTRPAWLTDDCYIRYVRELRGGDLFHIASGVIAVEPTALVLGHKVFDSVDGALCTTVEHRLRWAEAETARDASLSPAQRTAAAARQIPWDGPARERRPRPATLEGFRGTARSRFPTGGGEPIDPVLLSAYIHVFSAANGQALAAFGMTPTYMRERHHGFSTFEFQLALEGTVRPGAQVVVRSALVHLGKSSLRLLHVMTEPRGGRRVATLEQFGVHFDQRARRATPLPDPLRAAAEAILVRV